MSTALAEFIFNLLESFLPFNSQLFDLLAAVMSDSCPHATSTRQKFIGLVKEKYPDKESEVSELKCQFHSLLWFNYCRSFGQFSSKKPMFEVKILFS